MYLLELHSLIEDGENSTVEFKRKFSSPEKIAKEMIAFANSKGGQILFGIDDDRTIVGVESEKGELELIDTAARFYCEPEVVYETEIILIKNSDVVIVNIPESKNKPHKLLSDKDDEVKVYIRYNDKSVLASRETINILKGSNVKSHPVKINFGEIEKSLLKYLGDNEKITVKGFKKLVNISERRASRILVNLVRTEIIRHHRIDNNEFFTMI
ncbi:MAG: ATP-binding protein [Ignavibacteriae bacterium]|nr:ATP-binding protein [Ignavibacteriota bacterium]